MAHFITVAMGSSGDVNPFLGIARALKARGHRTTLLSAPQFARAAASVGAEFRALGSADAYDAIYADPDLWHPRRGLRIYFGYLSRLIGQTVDLIEERHEPGRTVVLAPFQCFGARVAQEAFGLPLCTVLPYPISIQSAYDPNRNPIGNPPRWMGPPAVRLMYRIINGEIARHTRRELNRVRSVRGLTPAVQNVVQWSYSTDRILGLWPTLFSSPQSDWPPQALTTGFVSYDGPAASDWTPPPNLPDRDDWLVFTPGTQMTHGADYFRAACVAASALGVPTLMVAKERSALPAELPDNVRHLTFAPFGWLFRRASAVVHHGGIGTAGRALESGLPQLIVPRGFDQFDNAQRVTKIGTGISLSRKRLNGPRLTAALRRLMNDSGIRRRCEEVQRSLAGVDSLTETCTVVEDML